MKQTQNVLPQIRWHLLLGSEQQRICKGVPLDTFVLFSV